MKMEQTVARMACIWNRAHKKKPGDGSKLLRRYNLWPRPVKSPSPTTSPTEFELKSLSCRFALLFVCAMKIN